MNKNLNRSKKVIDDEWYTRYEDIEKYLSNFKEELKGKTIYLPCDSKESNFYKFLDSKFEEWEIYNIYNSSNDFRNEKNEWYWKLADIIITNPPFSLKKDFYKLVKKHNCNLIVLLPDTLISNKEYKEDLINKKLFMDYTNKSFIKPDGSIKKASASWFNTFKKVWDKQWKYSSGSYVMTHDWIRLYNRCDNIDPTYTKEMYVPITFIKGNNINQYEIIDSCNGVKYNKSIAFNVLKIKKRKE